MAFHSILSNHFFVVEGKLPGFVVSKHGIMIDPKRMQEISQLHFPISKKSMPSFLGKINVVRIFGSGISQIVKPLQYMIKRMWNLSGIMIKKQDFCTNREASLKALLWYPQIFQTILLYKICF